MEILAQSLTSFPANLSDQISLKAIHPEDLRLELAGELSRGERRVYDIVYPWLMRKVRQGVAAYLTLSREWLARECRVSISTVARAFAAFRRLGLLIVKERWRRVGNLRRQVSNLLALPFQRPLVPPTERAWRRSHPERVKADSQTPILKKKTLNKVAFGSILFQKRPATDHNLATKSGPDILKEWAKRGLPPSDPNRHVPTRREENLL